MAASDAASSDDPVAVNRKNGAGCGHARFFFPERLGAKAAKTLPGVDSHAHAASGAASSDLPVADLGAGRPLLLARHGFPEGLGASARQALPGVDSRAAAAARNARSLNPRAVHYAGGHVAGRRSRHCSGAVSLKASSRVDPDSLAAGYAASSNDKFAHHGADHI